MKRRLHPIHKKISAISALSIILLLSLFTSAQAADADLKQGKALYKDKCARCHAKLIGRKITGSPKLANLKADYIAERLANYAQDDGDYAEEQKYKQKMIDTAKALSDSDIKNLAAYIADK